MNQLWEILDGNAIPSNSYTITIDDTTNPGLKTFSVYDSLRNQTVLSQCQNLSGEEDTPTIDGLKLLIIDEDGITFDSEKSGWIKESGDSSNCNWKLEATGLNPFPYDYEFRFNAQGDTCFYPPTMVLPFQVWNNSLNQQVAVASFTSSPNDTTDEMKATWTSGDVIRLREVIEGAIKFTWDLVIASDPLMIDTTLVIDDTTSIDTSLVDPEWADVPPVLGDVARFFMKKPLTSADKFILTAQGASSENATEKDLDNIQVIPNPYTITSSYETKPWIKDIQFHNLPEECEIRIFTVSGDLVQILHHESNSDGYRGPAVEAWNLWTYNNQEVAFGIYIFHVKAEGIGEKLGKFAIIK